MGSLRDACSRPWIGARVCITFSQQWDGGLCYISPTPVPVVVQLEQICCSAMQHWLLLLLCPSNPDCVRLCGQRRGIVNSVPVARQHRTHHKSLTTARSHMRNSGFVDLNRLARPRLVLLLLAAAHTPTMGSENNYLPINDPNWARSGVLVISFE